MTTPRRPVVGLVTIGQSPRPDVVPDMAEITGPGVEIREAGALDGLGRAAIDALAPREGDEILVTRLADGAPVFLSDFTKLRATRSWSRCRPTRRKIRRPATSCAS